MKKVPIVLLLPALLCGAALLSGTIPAAPPPPQQASPAQEAELDSALQERLDIAPGAQVLEGVEPFDISLDEAFVSEDGESAVLWLAMHNPQTGAVLGTEPGLALAERSADGWRVILPADPAWNEAAANLPENLMPAGSPAGFSENMAASGDPDEVKPQTADATLSGYYLPWAAGISRKLEGSVAHFHTFSQFGYPSCEMAYCRYAYDFSDGTQYWLLASHAGKVYSQRDSCTDYSSSCTNYIVLVDESISPPAYQIYLHLKHNSIPDKLSNGVSVARGQAIGQVDDTGYSTTEHVHFMVTRGVWFGGPAYATYPWGYSVDVRFADVAINNGVPRTCFELAYGLDYGAPVCLGSEADPWNSANDWFVSGNAGAFIPSGKITNPAPGATVAAGSGTGVIDVSATLSDDLGVSKARLVVRQPDSSWREIGPWLERWGDGSWNGDLNLCTEKLFNGSYQIALKAWDVEGNVAVPVGAQSINVDHACPPPASALTALPAQSAGSTAVQLHWSATDSGAGLGSFEIQYAEAGAGWSSTNLITTAGSARSAWFVGQMGKNYVFRMRAIDPFGQPEAFPASEASETGTALPVSCTPDAQEDEDDTMSGSTPLITLGLPSQRNLCGLVGAVDSDWSRLSLTGSKNLVILVQSVSGGAAARVKVFSSASNVMLAEFQAGGVGQKAFYFLRHVPPGELWIEVRPLVDDLAGSEAVYRLLVGEAQDVFLPGVAK